MGVANGAAASEFERLVKERRSANLFLPGYEMTDKELHDIFELVKYGPSAFNLQHAKYIVVRDPDVKERVYEAANRQYKIKAASAAVVVLGHLDAHLDAPRMNEGLLQLGAISKQEFDLTVQSVLSFYESRGESFKRDEAIRNANLSAMLFMLAAKDKGWDTCPMIGFDPQALAEALQVPDRYVPALLIAVGKEDESKRRLRGYRKPVNEFVGFDRF